MKLPIRIVCPCGRESLVTGDGADLIRLVEEKNELVRELAAAQALNHSLAERCHKQSELLSRKAELSKGK
jgi:hypothetical protein